MPDLSFSDIVTFEDDVVPTTKVESLEDVLKFIEDIFPGQLFLTVGDYIYLGDGIIIGLGATFNRPLADSLVFAEEIHPRRHIESAGDFLYLMDWLELPTATHVFDTIIFSEILDVSSGPAMSDSLDLEDFFTLKIMPRLTISDSLELVEGISIYINNPWAPTGPVPEEAPCV